MSAPVSGLRVLGAGVLVELHPRQKKSSVIELPTNESSVLTGTVVKVGPGTLKSKRDPAQPMFLKPGDKVAFLRWNQEHQTGKQVQRHLDEIVPGHALIAQRDVLFVYEGEVQVDL